MSAEQSKSAGPVTPRRRPGRFRRWLVRPLAWLLTTLVALLLVAWIVGRSEWVQREVAAWAVARVERELGRQVTIDRLSLSLLPLAVRAEGVVLAGPGPDAPPVVEIERLSAEATVSRRGGWRIALDEITVERPRVRIEIAEDGTTNLPRLDFGGGGEARAEVRLELLRVEDGVLELDHRRVPLEFTARGVTARLWGGRPPLQFRATAAEVEVTLPGAEPYSGGLAAQGRIGEGALELVQARLSGPDLAARVTGRLELAGERSGQFDFDAESDLRLLDRLGYTGGEMAGAVAAQGTLFWDPGDWGVQAAVTSPDVTLLERRLRGVRGVVTGDRERFLLELQEATYAQGSLAGDVRFELAPAERRAVALDLRLRAIDLETLLADQSIPLRGINSAVSGVFSYRFPWGAAERGDGWADLRIRPQVRPGPGLGFGGTAPLTIANGRIGTRAARLRSGFQRVEASGAYDLAARRGEFDLRVDSGRVDELLDLLAIGADDPEAAWRPSSGRGEIDALLRLDAASGVTVDLRLALEDVVAPGARAARLGGTMSVDATAVRDLRLELLRDDAALIVVGDLPLAGPEAADGAPPFRLDVDAVGWPLGEAAVWLPFELPVDGPATGAVRLSGSPTEPSGEADLEVAPASLQGVEVDRLRARLGFDPEAVVAHEVTLAVPAGEIVVEGRWDRSSDAIDFRLGSRPGEEGAEAGLDLAGGPFADWLPGELSGRLEVTARLEGSLAAPRLAAALVGSDLALASSDLGEAGRAALELEWADGRLAAAGSLLGLVAVAGGGELGAERLDLELGLAVEELDALLRLAGLALPDLSGAADGRLRVAGPMGGEWATSLELDRLSLVYRERVLRNLEPVLLRWAGDGVAVDSLYLGEEGSADDLFVAGRIGFTDPVTLDLRLQSSVDTAWVGLLLPQLELQGGRFDVLATLGGTFEELRIVGQGEISGARMPAGPLPYTFNDLRGAVLFYPGLVVLDSVRGGFAGGTVLVGGNVRLPEPGGELDLRLQATGRDLTVRYPEGWELRGDAELSLVSSGEGRQVRGSVELERALYSRRLQVGLAQLLQGFFQRRRVEVESTDEFLASTQLNVLVDGPDALRVRNNVANLRGSLDLAVRGTLARPVLFGRVEVEPGGTLQFAGSDYTVDRGFLTFANPYRLEPVIDLTATTERRDYNLALTLSGTLERLNASIASDPPLPDLEVLGLLTSSDGAPTGGASGAATAEAFLYGQAASLVTERVNRLFGFDKFRVDPLTGSGASLSSARVTVGKQLSRDIVATYTYDPTLTEQQILQLEWQVARGFVLVLTQNGDDTYAVDARWEKSF